MILTPGSERNNFGVVTCCDMPMDDLLEEDLIDAQDAREVAHHSGCMIRNTAQPKLYWSDDGGWSSYSEADIYLAVDRTVKDLPEQGEWIELGEAAPVKQLKQMLPDTFCESVQQVIQSKGFLVEQEWQAGGRRLLIRAPCVEIS